MITVSGPRWRGRGLKYVFGKKKKKKINCKKSGDSGRAEESRLPRTAAPASRVRMAGLLVPLT